MLHRHVLAYADMPLHRLGLGKVKRPLKACVINDQAGV